MACLCIVLAAPAAADGKRLSTEKQFRELVVDRQLTGDRTSLLYTGDGRMAGASHGKRIEGTWRWVDAALCRKVTWGSRELGYDCLAIFVIGDLVILVRDERRGRAFALWFRSEDSQPAYSEELLARCDC